MKGQWKNGWRVAMVLFATAALGAAATNTMPSPGMVNYVEGQAALNGQDLNARSAGSAVLGAGQVLETGQGRVELLLTPGVFLRVGDNSAVRMVSPGLADTTVEIQRGTALLEVADFVPENRLSILVGNAATRTEKKGLYLFDADRRSVSVLDGKAAVSAGGPEQTLKKGREIVLADGQPLQARGFDRNALESEPLYRWSKVRGEYEAQANMHAANTVLVEGGWYGPGWYWDPFWGSYAYLPAAGMLWSPWGWGFYSPGWVWRAPIYRFHTLGHGYAYGPHLSRRYGAVTRGFATQPRMVSPRMGGSLGMRGGFHGGGGRR